MRKKKITMVNLEQITARGWKGLKTRKVVENFTIKNHVHHVYWRAPGNKKILLVDYDHFREIWQEYKKGQKQSTSFKRISSYRKPITRRTTKSRTSTRRTTRKPVVRRRAVSNRPKTRTRFTTRRYTR
jgi:hypothetical protein